MLLNPIIWQLEIQLSRGAMLPCANEGQTSNVAHKEVTWANADLQDIIALLPTAASYTAAPPLTTVQAGVTSLLGLLHAICAAAEQMEVCRKGKVPLEHSAVVMYSGE